MVGEAWACSAAGTPPSASVAHVTSAKRTVFRVPSLAGISHSLLMADSPAQHRMRRIAARQSARLAQRVTLAAMPTIPQTIQRGAPRD